MVEVVDVHLDLCDKASQTFKVSLKWKPRTHRQSWSLPIWTPGSYTIRDHVQYLHSLSLSQASNDCQVQRIGPSGWKADLDTLDLVTLGYVIEARQLTVRTCYLDPEFASLCLAAAVMEIDGQRWTPHCLTLALPAGWNAYVPLAGEETLWAKDFDHLVDAPIHAGCFVSQPFVVKKNSHQLLCIGDPPMGWPANLVNDVSAICKATCCLMDEPPPAGDLYQLVIHMLETGYGGLEHDYGAVLHYSWRALTEPDGYRKLLQLIGHEYLHQWNVRRLRPREYRPYDYSQAVISDGLWFAEGITSYLDLTLPFLAGLSDRSTLLKDLSLEFSPLLINPGRQVQSLADSSREAWVKLYKATPASADSQVSYYKLGAAMAFCLDVRLRQQNSSLTQVLRDLWRKFGGSHRGYSRLDIKAAIAKFDPNTANEVDAWLDQPDSLPLTSIVTDLGLRFEERYSNKRETGLTLVEREGLIYVSRVALSSPAHHAGLVVGDELLAVGGFRLRKVDDLYKLISNEEPVSITFSRRGRLSETALSSGLPQVDHWEIIIDSEAPSELSNLRDRWFQII